MSDVFMVVLYQERSKALGYIESNVSTAGLRPMDDREAQRAPDNVNQLCVTIVQCRNVQSRRKGVLTVDNGSSFIIATYNM